MTGFDILKKAAVLCGYAVGTDGAASQRSFEARGAELICRILADLKLKPVSGLSDALELTAAEADALCYGTAMLLTLTEGDTGKNGIFTDIYNSKRAAALASVSAVKDCLPTVYEG